MPGRHRAARRCRVHRTAPTTTASSWSTSLRGRYPAGQAVATTITLQSAGILNGDVDPPVTGAAARWADAFAAGCCALALAPWRLTRGARPTHEWRGSMSVLGAYTECKPDEAAWNDLEKGDFYSE